MPPATLEELITPHLVLEGGSSKGGNQGFHCTHCSKLFNGSQTRQLAPLLGITGKGIAVCKEIPLEDRASLQKACDDVRLVTERGISSGSLPESQTGVYHRPYAWLLWCENAGDNVHDNE